MKNILFVYALLVNCLLGFTVVAQVKQPTSCKSYPQLSICMVTVNSTFQQNEIVWEKIIDPDIQAYYIYKETDTVGVYALVTKQMANLPSVFYDSLSSPNTKSETYKIAIEDICGISDMSSEVKSIHAWYTLGVDSVQIKWIQPLSNTPLLYGSYEIMQGTIVDSLGQIQTGLTSSLSSNDTASLSFAKSMFNVGTNYIQIEATKINPCTTSKKKGVETIYARSVSNIVDFEIAPVGIKKQQANNIFQVFPNPANDILTIQWTKIPKGNATITIFNILNQPVYTKLESNILDNNMHIDISALDAGCYFIRVNHSTASETLRMIKK